MSTRPTKRNADLNTPQREHDRQRLAEIIDILAESYPGAERELCELNFANPFHLLVMTILAAQSTDVRVNLVAPALFARYPSVSALASADQTEVEQLVHSTGFFRNKARNIIAMAQRVRDEFGGVIPSEMEELVTLPGVGRKTANVVRSAAMGLPGLAVDTHVTRLANRLGFVATKDAVKIETVLCDLADQSEWGALSLRLVLHGRRVCVARRPMCAECDLAPLCPSADLPEGLGKSSLSGGK